MSHRTAKGWLAAAATVVVTISASRQAALAAGPADISVQDKTGWLYLCTSASPSATYDAGGTATSKNIYLSVGNNSADEVTAVTATLTGSQVPGIFKVIYNNNLGYLPPNKLFSFIVSFTPPAGDPAGTSYGGDASKVVMHVEYTYKPKKGKKAVGTPMDLVLTAQKQ